MSGRAACVAHVGSGEFGRVVDALAELRGRFGRIPVYPVQAPGEAGEAVRELTPGLDVLAVLGGDGTIHDAVGGLPLGPDGPAVALLPGGTGNDLVRGLGLPLDAAAAARAAAAGAPRALDLLDCDGDRAANGVNAGFAAAATDVLSRRVKLLLGPAAYVVPAGVGKGRLAAGLVRRRLPGGLPRFRGPSAALRTDMPCRLDGEPRPTPGSVTVLPGAWRVLLPTA